MLLLIMALIAQLVKSYNASLIAQLIKNPLAMWETPVQFLGWEDPLEEGVETTPVFLPREPHGQRSLAGYPSIRSQRVGHD